MECTWYFYLIQNIFHGRHSKTNSHKTILEISKPSDERKAALAADAIALRVPLAPQAASQDTSAAVKQPCEQERREGILPGWVH